MSTLYGLNVVESPFCANVQRMWLCPKVAEIIAHSKPEFVASINQWMLEFFGTEDRAYIIGDRYFMSPKAAAMLRERRFDGLPPRPKA